MGPMLLRGAGGQWFGNNDFILFFIFPKIGSERNGPNRWGLALDARNATCEWRRTNDDLATLSILLEQRYLFIQPANGPTLFQ